MKSNSWIKRVLEDTRLPADTRLLLGWLGTRPAGWRYSVDEAVQASGVERKKYQRMLATLKAAGWVVAEHKRDRFGRIKYTKLTLRDAPTEGVNYTLGRRRPRVPNETLRTEGANSTQTSSLDRTGNPEGGTVKDCIPPTGSQADPWDIAPNEEPDEALRFTGDAAPAAAGLVGARDAVPTVLFGARNRRARI